MRRQDAVILLHMAPSAVFLLVTGLFVGRDAGGVFEPRLLLPILNTVFVTALPLAIALLALRSYVEQGTRILLLFGCGLVAPAVGGFLAGWGLPANGANYLVTVHNIGVLVGGGCHLAAAATLVGGSPSRTGLARPAAIRVGAGAYAGSGLLVALIAVLAAAGRTPAFFVNGAGPTVIRQLVLSAAGVCYLAGAVLLVGLYARTGMAFFALYANALFLTATGLAAVAAFTTAGGALSWTSRAAVYAGNFYFVAALFVHTGPPRRRGMSLPGYLSELLRAHLDEEVRYRTKDLVELNARLKKEIEERRQLDEELRASEERLRLAAKASGFGVFSCDIPSRQAYLSPELLALFGQPPGGHVELEPGLVPRAVPPQDRPALGSLIATWIDPRGPGIIDAEFRILRPDGEERWLRARGKVSFQDRGTGPAPGRADGIVQDVTVEKLAEEKLQEREQIYRFLIENSLQGIAIVQAGRIVLCNDALCAMNGYSEEETYRMTPGQIVETIHPLDRPRVTEALQGLADSADARPTLFIRLLHKSGDVRWVHVHGGQILFRGQPAIQISYVDVTTERRAEEAYRTLVENAADGYSLQVEGRVEYANAALAQVVGCTTLELRQMSAEDLSLIVHPEDRSRFMDGLLQPPAGRHLSNQTFRIRRRDGVWRTLEARSVRVEYEGAHAIQTSYRDVTEVLAAQQALDETYRKLRNLAAHLLRAREEERRRVAQQVHDDLGQALAALKMDAHWLRHHLRRSTPAVARKLDDMIELGEQTIGSVQRISSDLRPRMLDDLGLAPSLDWLAAEFRRRTGLPCRLSVDVPPGKLGVNAATSLYRVVQEALSNIARHSLARHAEVRLATEDGVAVLSVQDDGIGISPAQASAADSLGLIGARERIEVLGGSLLVVGEPGKGTLLTARIPLPAEGGLA